jgi:predicted RecB family nuclease
LTSRPLFSTPFELEIIPFAAAPKEPRSYDQARKTRTDELRPGTSATSRRCSGDREGWLAFLAAARDVLSRCGDVPFVHWASYEKSKLARYVERYGDPDAVAGRIGANLVDLLEVTQAAVVLPLPSYSLKVVEKHIGFQRTLPEANGDWSMAACIEAVESEDAGRRAQLMDEIRQYNQEDLDATWAVLEWLRRRGRRGSPPSRERGRLQ